MGLADPHAVKTPSTASVAILLNANAKRVSRRLVQQLNSYAPTTDIFLTHSLEEAEHAVRIILGCGYRTLVVGGGDGTVASALSMLARARAQGIIHGYPKLAVLRLGTGNALASWLQAGAVLKDLERVLESTNLPTIPLRVLEDPSSGEVFTFGSVGYDAQVLNDYVDLVKATHHPLLRWMAKSLAGYVYAVATRTLAAELRRGTTRVTVYARGPASLIDPYTRQEVSLDSDAVLFEGAARAVLMGTTPNYGFGMQVLPFATRRRDRFHLRVSTATVPYILYHLRSIWKGELRTPHFLDFLVEEVELSLSQALPLQCSGDGRGHVQTLKARLSNRSFGILQTREGRYAWKTPNPIA